MNLFVLDDREARIQIPHYWALYVHDGRSAPFGAVQAQFLVWFRNPKDDPRLRGGISPVRAKDLRQLTPSEFRYWLARNREADPDGTNPRLRPMIVTRQIRTPTQARRFFSNEAGGGMQRFPPEARRIIAEEFSGFVRAQMGDLMNVKGSITVQL